MTYMWIAHQKRPDIVLIFPCSTAMEGQGDLYNVGSEEFEQQPSSNHPSHALLRNRHDGQRTLLSVFMNEIETLHSEEE